MNVPLRKKDRSHDVGGATPASSEGAGSVPAPPCLDACWASSAGGALSACVPPFIPLYKPCSVLTTFF